MLQKISVIESVVASKIYDFLLSKCIHIDVIYLGNFDYQYRNREGVINRLMLIYRLANI